MKFRNASGRFFLITVFVILLTSIPMDIRTLAGDRNPADSLNYIWPTSASRALTSSFAETRDDHYHFGIDIKTNGGEGYPCFAVESGSVVRLRISPYGYGKALYLQLDDGRIAVYAHLQKFASKIEKIVTERQYQDEQFRCQMYFEIGEITVKRGEILAFSGSTGIGSPHLHFEIRDEDGYQNAMRYGFTVDDSWAPTAKKLAFIPREFEAEINGEFEPVIYNLSADETLGLNSYLLNETPAIHGRVGVGISTYDHTDRAPNLISIYGLDLYLDDSLSYSVRYDAFRYEEVKEIELERNFRLRRRTKETFHHLFKNPHMTADIFHAGDGTLDSREIISGLHEFEIVLWDFNGNSSHVRGHIEVVDEAQYPDSPRFSRYAGFLGHYLNSSASQSSLSLVDSHLKAEFFDDYIAFSLPRENYQEEVHLFLSTPYQAHIPLIERPTEWIGKISLEPFPAARWAIEVQIRNENGSVNFDTSSWYIQPVLPKGGTVTSEDGIFKANFKPGTVYEPLFVRIDADEAPEEKHFIGHIYSIEPFDVPIRGDVEVTFAIPEDVANPEQLGIYIFSKKEEWQFWDNDSTKIPGHIFAETPSLEKYAFIRDDTPPTLRWLAPNQTASNRRPIFRLKVIDKLSGVDDRTLRFEIDGKWLLMEYDFEEDRIFGRPEAPLDPGDHRVTLSVKDFCGNEAKLERTIKITNP